VVTSEAGSCCPPAEADTRELAQHPNVPALTFRADSADTLGWGDRLGWPDSMKRQRSLTRSRRLFGTSPAAFDERKSLLGNDRASVGRDLATRRDASVKFPIRGGDWPTHRLVAEKHCTRDHRIQHRAVIAHDEPMDWRLKRGSGRRLLLDDASDAAIRSLSQVLLTGAASPSRNPSDFEPLTNSGATRTRKHYARLTYSSPPAARPMVLKADCVR
jgi:hypothetical protein